MKQIRISIIATFLLVALMHASAQDERPDMPLRGPGFERIERLKKVRLMEVLKLNEEASIRFFARYNAYQDELKAFQQRRQSAVTKVEDVRNANASDVEIEKAVESLRSLDLTFIELRDKHWKDIREILSMKQFGAYVTFEHNFQRYLRELMRDVQRDRPGGRMMQRRQ